MWYLLMLLHGVVRIMQQSLGCHLLLTILHISHLYQEKLHLESKNKNKQQKKKLNKKQKEGKANSSLVAKTKGVLSAHHMSPKPKHPQCSNRHEECEV